jgi:hypothetical protein
VSDSHAIPRATTRDRAARKPPKRPRGQPIPWWASVYMLVRFAAFYFFASKVNDVGDSLYAGLSLAYAAWQVRLTWQWRQWQRHSGERPPPHPWIECIVWGALVATAAIRDAVEYAVNGKLPWEWWLES